MPGQPEEHRQGNRAGLISLLVAALTAAPARAVEASAERPTLPSWSTAGDDGAAALWSNPANLALDPSPSWFILYQQNVDQDAPGRLAMATNLGPLGAGLSYRSASVDGTVPAWWSLSAALSLRLDQQFGIGGAVGWQIPEGDQQNFALWDLGASWRPLTWFGMSAVSRNVGSDQARVDPRFGPAVAFRPWGDKVTLGLDYLLSNNVTTPGAFAANLRLHPREGLVVRGSVDQVGTLGAGLEIYFGRSGMGAHGYLPTNGGVANLALYGASTAPEERLIGHGHRVPTFRIADSYPYNPPSAFFLGESAESYLHLLQRLERAARDPGVDGIVLELDATPFSLAQIEELRAVLAVAKLNKKPIYVYLDKATSNGAYLLAASADKVFLHPAGELSLIGLSMELQFFRSTLDLVGVKAQFARRSEYKSGPEQYTSSEASPGTREEMESLVDDLSAAWRRGIADSRGKTDEQILKLVDGGPYTAAEALEKGLVDRLAYPDEFEKEVDAAFDGEANFDESYGVEDAANGWRASREIAVIYVVGEIVTGESGYSGGLLGGGSAVTGGDTVVRQLEQARGDDSVKAVVLRVDSPGGSAFASDEIYRAISRVQEADKPVVVSMGGLAASGGYYVAAGATAIYALPSTITGSIGVYSGKFNLESLYEKLGVGSEIYKRGRNAAMWSMSHPMDDIEFAAMDRMVGETYRQFKDRVMKGRSLDESQVEAVARGRVWSGQAAKQNGLVDELGGFADAVARARREAGISENVHVELISYGAYPLASGELVTQAVRAAELGLQDRLTARSPAMPETLQALEDMRRLSDEKVWMLLPYRLEVR